MNTSQFRDKYINDGPIMTTTPDMAFEMPSVPIPSIKPTAPKSGATRQAPQTLQTMSSLNSKPTNLPRIDNESANAAAEANVTYVPPAYRELTVVPLKKPISPIVYIGGGLILLKLLKVF
jgi:hypothetical protein